MHHHLFLCWIVVLTCCSTSQSWAQQLSKRTNNYDINLTLNTDQKKISAEQTIVFTNPSSDTIQDLQFHLYYNAFKNTNSTFYQDQDGLKRFGNFEGTAGCSWGWLDVQSMADAAGNDLAAKMHYITPDDDNTLDQTVLRVPLAAPLLPHDSVRVSMTWTSKIPHISIRTGYNKDFYFFVQWFPKLGVYEPAGMRYAQQGAWNCHQYHASGEYYGEFGNYNVSMTVPDDFILGASGQQTSKTSSNGQTSWTYFANDVIDFAWTCSPKFRVVEDRWKKVDLKILTYDSHQACSDKYFKIIKEAFAYLDEHVGAYPYSTFTLVDPPLHGLFVGGMEYPTLITSINLCFLPNGLRTTETLTTHELVHQYFMQMIATHEVEEPWMDEGITTYFEGRILDHYYGERTSLANYAGIKVGNGEYNRAEFFAMSNPKIADNSLRSWQYKHGGYGPISYNKTAIWLKTLERMVGLPTMDEIMKTYFERWKFKHPCGRNFEEVANEVVLKNHGDQFGDNLNWFFDQVLRSSDVCDYKVAQIQNEDIPAPSGFIDDLNDCVSSEDLPIAHKLSRVTLHRIGELKFPQEVKINFADGSSVIKNWDGQSRSTDFTFKGDQKIISAEIDPNRKIYLDKDFSNNSLTVVENKKGLRYYFYRALNVTQNSLMALSSLI